MLKLKIILFLAVFLMSYSMATAQDINWMSLERAQQLASQNDKKVLLFAEASWCHYCKRMNKEVFPQKAVKDSLQKYFYAVRIDVESNQKTIFNGKTFTQKSLSRQFRVSGTPTTIFLDSDGSILGTQPGFLKSEIFDKLLSYVGAEYYQESSFNKYLNQHGVHLNK